MSELGKKPIDRTYLASQFQSYNDQVKANLVANTRTIAGIDLKDDITAVELKNALGYLSSSEIQAMIDSTINNTFKTYPSLIVNK